MAQHDPKTLTGADDGDDLIVDIGNRADIFLTLNSGPTEPAYKQAGTLWLKTGAAALPLNLWDGAQWIPLGVFDTANNLFRVAADADLDSYIAATDTDDEIAVTVGGTLRALFTGESLRLDTPLTFGSATTHTTLPTTTTTGFGTGTASGVVAVDETTSRVKIRIGTVTHELAHTTDTATGSILGATDFSGPGTPGLPLQISANGTQVLSDTITAGGLADNALAGGGIVSISKGTQTATITVTSSAVVNAASAGLTLGSLTNTQDVDDANDNTVLIRRPGGNGKWTAGTVQGTGGIGVSVSNDRLTIDGSGITGGGGGGGLTAAQVREQVVLMSTGTAGITVTAGGTGASRTLTVSLSLASGANPGGIKTGGDLALSNGTASLNDDAVTLAKIAATGTDGQVPTISGSGDSRVVIWKTPSGGGGGTPGDGSITTAKLADDAVTQDKIADNAVGNAQMADNAVGLSEINAGSGSNGQFLQRGATGLAWAAPTASVADGAVTTAKLADDAVTDAKINSTAFATLDQAVTGTDQVKIINAKTLADLRARLDASYELTNYTARTNASNMPAGSFWADIDNGRLYIQPDGISARTGIAARALAGQYATAEDGYGNILTGIINSVTGGDGTTRFQINLATPYTSAGTFTSAARLHIEGLRAYAHRTTELADGLVVARNIRDNAVGADALNVSGDGTSGQVLTSDGDGSMSWANQSGGTPGDGSITTAKLADDAVTADKVADNAIGAPALNVSGNGTAGQVLASDGDGSMSWTRDFSATIKGLAASGGPDIGTLLGRLPSGTNVPNGVTPTTSGLLPVPHPNQNSTPSGTGEVTFTPLSTDSTFRCDLSIGFGWNNSSSGTRTFHAFLLRKIGTAAETVAARVGFWIAIPQQGGDFQGYTFYVDAPNTTSTVRYRWVISRAHGGQFGPERQRLPQRAVGVVHRVPQQGLGA